MTNDGVYEFKTQSDNLVGYLFKPWCYYIAVVDYHVTRTGSLICDDITYGVYKGCNDEKKNDRQN